MLVRVGASGLHILFIFIPVNWPGTGDPSEQFSILGKLGGSSKAPPSFSCRMLVAKHGHSQKTGGEEHQAAGEVTKR